MTETEARIQDYLCSTGEPKSIAEIAVATERSYHTISCACRMLSARGTAECVTTNPKNKQYRAVPAAMERRHGAQK